MAVKKVSYGGQTLIDLTSDTVASAADIAVGKIGHTNTGEVVTGTHSGGTAEFTRWKNRPSGAPNIDLIDLTDFYGCYCTIDKNRWYNDRTKLTDATCMTVNLSVSHTITKGHLSSGAYVVDETLYSNVTGSHTVTIDGSWEDYPIIRVQCASGYEINYAAKYCLELVIKSTAAAGRIGANAIQGDYSRLRVIGFNNSYVNNNICNSYQCEQLELEDADFTYTNSSGNFTNFIPPNVKKLILKNIDFSGGITAPILSNNNQALRNVEYEDITIGTSSYSMVNFMRSLKFDSIDVSDLVSENTTSLAQAFWETSGHKIEMHNKNFTALTNCSNMLYRMVFDIIDFSGCKWPAVTSENSFKLDAYNDGGDLQYLRLGEIYSDASFSKSTKLTHDNLVEIINDLGTVSEATLTMGATNLAKLSAAEIAVATGKGWTLA